MGGKGLDGVTPPSFPAQEKLRYLQQQLQDETPRRQEAELQELEQKLEAGLSRHGLGPAAQPPGCSGPPGSPKEPPRPRGMVPGGWGMGLRAGEGPTVSEQELQKVSAGLEELRRVGRRARCEASRTRLGRARGWSVKDYNGTRASGVELKRAQGGVCWGS